MNVFQLYQDKEESDVIDNSVKLEKEKKNKKQRGKFELPNDIEIDNYLLETVFNVDFSKISDVKT